MAVALASHAASGSLMQLAVNLRRQLLQRTFVSAPPGLQELRDLVSEPFGHATAKRVRGKANRLGGTVPQFRSFFPAHCRFRTQFSLLRVGTRTFSVPERKRSEYERSDYEALPNSPGRTRFAGGLAWRMRPSPESSRGLERHRAEHHRGDGKERPPTRCGLFHLRECRHVRRRKRG